MGTYRKKVQKVQSFRNPRFTGNNAGCIWSAVPPALPKVEASAGLKTEKKVQPGQNPELVQPANRSPSQTKVDTIKKDSGGNAVILCRGGCGQQIHKTNNAQKFCRECARRRHREQMSAWQRAHPGYAITHTAAWRKKNPEKAKAAERRQNRSEGKKRRARKYYESHKADYQRRALAWLNKSEANRAKAREASRRWHQRQKAMKK